MSNPHSFSHGAVCAALGLGPDFAKGPGSLEEPLLVLFLGKVHTPLHQTCSLFLLPSAIAQTGPALAAFPLPRIGCCTPHNPSHLISSGPGCGLSPSKAMPHSVPFLLRSCPAMRPRSAVRGLPCGQALASVLGAGGERQALSWESQILLDLFLSLC